VKSRGREGGPLFDKKFHNRPGQKVNYLNALSDARFDEVSCERDLSPASHYGAETNADVRSEEHSARKYISARLCRPKITERGVGPPQGVCACAEFGISNN